MDQLDPSLKHLLKEAGVSESEIKDKETAGFIYDFIEQRGGMDAVKREQSVRPKKVSTPEFVSAYTPPSPTPPPAAISAPTPAPATLGELFVYVLSNKRNASEHYS